MRKILCLLLSFVGLSAFALDYVVEGDVNYLDGKHIYLYDYDRQTYIDTALVTDGHFRFEGQYDRNAYVRVERENLYANGILDTLVVIDMDSHRPVNAYGLNLALKQYEDAEDAWVEDLGKFYQEVKAHGFSDEETGNIYKLLYDKYAPERRRLYVNTVIDNPNGVGEALLLSFDWFLIKPETWDTLWAQMQPPLKDTRLAQDRNKLMQAKKLSMPGQPFIDFEGKTLEGQTVRLSDYVGTGKYVLVDFYASWCGPCKQEAKATLIPLYEKYGGAENFEIVGAAVWDAPESTRQFLETAGYAWPQMIDCGMLPMELYGLEGVPMIFLFAPDGTILERELRGTQLVRAVEAVL